MTDLRPGTWVRRYWPDGSFADYPYTAEAAALLVPPALDAARLYEAIVAELVLLWGEPSDAVSVQVRPIVARNIADRYAALSGAATPDPAP